MRSARKEQEEVKEAIEPENEKPKLLEHAGVIELLPMELEAEGGKLELLATSVTEDAASKTRGIFEIAS